MQETASRQLREEQTTSTSRRWVHAVRLSVGLLSLMLGGPARAEDVVEAVITDALGNIRVITDDQGNVLERHDYLPFGEECTTGPCASNPGVGAGQPRKFTGKERDQETGLDYFGARYYSAPVGRFTTVDPSITIRENTLDPQRWNRYAYGRNNPLRFVDPDGRDWLFRAVMGQQYVQQYGDRSSFSVFFQGISGDIARAGPPFQEQMAIDLTIASLITGFTPAPREAPAPAPRGVQANKAAGDAWSQAVGTELKATHEVAVPEVTVRTQSGARTRLDWVTKDSGTIGCVECKASGTAPLTRGQAAAHPEIARTGAVVAGKGKPGIPGGTVIPPTPVQVRRPE